MARYHYALDVRARRLCRFYDERDRETICNVEEFKRLTPLQALLTRTVRGRWKCASLRKTHGVNAIPFWTFQFKDLR